MPSGFVLILKKIKESGSRFGFSYILSHTRCVHTNTIGSLLVSEVTVQQKYTLCLKKKHVTTFFAIT